jgi:hypothetical protein
MPQPLPNSVKIDIQDALALHPELGLYIARIANAWSNVEFLMAQLLGRLMNAEARPALALYKSLTSHRAQREALKAAAAATLRPSISSRVEKLMKEARRRADERNRIVHAMWGASSAVGNAIICLDHHELGLGLVESRHGHFYGYSDEELAALPMHEAQNMVYRAADFENTLRRLNHLVDGLAAFVREFG